MALRAGASGFLLKESLPDELVPAIRAVAAGQGLIGTSVTRSLIDEYASLAPPAKTDPRLLDLTAREYQTLRHVSSLPRKLGLGTRVQAVIFAYEQGLVRVGARRRGPLSRRE